MEIFPFDYPILSNIYDVQPSKLSPINYALFSHLIHERDATVNSILEEPIILNYESVSRDFT